MLDAAAGAYFSPRRCVAAHASDDYILQLAKLLFARVDPSLVIYYEYSNVRGGG